jgi:iron complex outermembrane recepter protein
MAGTIFNPPHWRGRAGATLDGEHATFSGFLNVVGSVIDNRFTVPEKVGAFLTVDLSASLRTGKGAGPFRDMELRLSALNLLNQKPRLIQTGSLGGAPYDSTNQSAVGRFLDVSIRKVW